MISAADTQNWKIDLDASGQITQMTYPNPATPLAVEKTLIFSLSAGGRPVNGRVEFANGFEREMKPGEVTSYFDMFQGAKAAWDYLQTNDKLTSIKSDSKIPSDWLGRQARVITKSGASIIGRLIAASSAGEWAIEADGACCGPVHFTMAGIQEVQEIKNP